MNTVQLLQLREKLSLKGEVMWEKTRGGILVAKSPWQQNQILSGDALGVSLFLDKLASINTYTLNITHAEIGDDDTPALATDTALGNGLERVSVSSVSRSGLTVTFRFFFPDALTTDDTYNEFGMYVDGSTALGSGRMFNHLILTTPLVKAAGEDNTLVCKVTATV